MIAFVKAKTAAIGYTAAVTLVLLQVVSPTMFDLVLDGMLLGAFYLSNKVKGKQD